MGIAVTDRVIAFLFGTIKKNFIIIAVNIPVIVSHTITLYPDRINDFT